MSAQLKQLQDHNFPGTTESSATEEFALAAGLGRPLSTSPPDTARTSTRRRNSTASKRFEAEAPIPAAHLRAVLEQSTARLLPSEICAEEAAEAYKQRPQPLPFARPPLHREEKAPLRLTLRATCDSAPLLPIAVSPKAKPSPSALRQLQDYNKTGAADPFPHALQPEGHTRTHAAPVESADYNRLCGIAMQTCIGAASEFTGVGAFEHGLQAGFKEAGLQMQLLQASELDNTSSGRVSFAVGRTHHQGCRCGRKQRRPRPPQHNSAVLRKRFTHCDVINQLQRIDLPLPPNAKLLVVTPVCTEHSPLNPSRSPWLTDEMLLPV